MGSPLLVLDEPTANLDPRGIEEVYDALAELVAEGDRAILLVEHNLDAAVGFVDRVVVLDQQGRLAADGSVDDVLRSARRRAPRDGRVAAGLGARGAAPAPRGLHARPAAADPGRAARGARGGAEPFAAPSAHRPGR